VEKKVNKNPKYSDVRIKVQVSDLFGRVIKGETVQSWDREIELSEIASHILDAIRNIDV